MVDNDATFFYQLILPFCDPSQSGVPQNPRRAFYTDALKFSNLYAFQNNLGTGPYGHHFDPMTLEDLVHFDGATVRNGVHGSNVSSIHRRWMPSSCSYDKEIHESINHYRWLQCKQVWKLCDNSKAPKRGEDGYDPAYKYDMLFAVIVHNVNQLTAYADLDQCGDETTFGHGRYGEPGSGLWNRFANKPVTKGGQIVLVCDKHRVRPRAYTHRHKLHVVPDGWEKYQGPLEVRRLVEKLKPMCSLEQDVLDVRKIFGDYPHMTWDNHFSGDQIMDWLGEQGFGATMTCRRDRLPGGIPSMYFHKGQTAVTDRSKASRFLQPVVAVKTTRFPREDARKNYTRVHVSFQSTSSCNISTVNAVNSVARDVRKKERGKGIKQAYMGH